MCTSVLFGYPIAIWLIEELAVFFILKTFVYEKVSKLSRKVLHLLFKIIIKDNLIL